MSTDLSRQARDWVAHGATLLDVRNPEEYAQRHLPGALNIPLAELPQRLSELGGPERRLVVYCMSGMRSAKASDLLKKAGFAQVLNLGSLNAW